MHPRPSTHNAINQQPAVHLLCQAPAARQPPQRDQRGPGGWVGRVLVRIFTPSLHHGWHAHTHTHKRTYPPLSPHPASVPYPPPLTPSPSCPPRRRLRLQIVLNLGLGFHAPDLEVVVAAKTPVASIPLAVKNIWFEVRRAEGKKGFIRSTPKEDSDLIHL